MADCCNRVYLANTGKILNTNPVEMKTFNGASLMMGAIKFPMIRMYWNRLIAISAIKVAFSRDRYSRLQQHLKFVDDNSFR